MKGRVFAVCGPLTVLASLLLLLYLAPAAWAGHDVWTTRSLLGYRIQTLAVDPQASHRLYAGTDQGLLYSPDGGGQWSAMTTPFRGVTAIAMDPHEPTTFYAIGDSKLYKSVDEGGTWAILGSGVLDRPYYLVFSPQEAGTVYVGTSSGAFRTTDGGVSWAGLGLPAMGWVTAIAVDPEDPDTIYASVQGQGLFESTDGGQSWALVGGGLPEGVGLKFLSFDPGDRRILYSLDDRGRTFKSTDAAKNWSQFYAEERLNASLMATDPHQGGRVYVAGQGRGLFRSDDRGGSWTEVGQGLRERPTITALIFDPEVAGVLYAIESGQLHKSFDAGSNWVPAQYTGNLLFLKRHPTLPNRLYAALDRAGVHVSDDGGSTWQASNTGLPEGTNLTTLAFDPQNPNTLYAGTQQGLYRSVDGGTEWAITSLPTNVAVNVFAVSPEDSNHLLVGSREGVLLSTNGGASWTAVALPQGGRVTALAFQPETPDTVYAGTNSGFFQSTDGGASWAGADDLLRQSVAAIAIHPSSPSTVYVASNQGVFRTTEESGSWTQRNEGLPRNLQIRSLVTDPQNPEVLYAGTNNGVFVSPNAGGAWYAINEGLGTTNVTQLLALETEPTSLLALVAFRYGNVLWDYAVGTIPTPTPTLTPVPTVTPLPTRTPMPAPTSLPTALPAPDRTPSPTPPAGEEEPEPSDPGSGSGETAPDGGSPWLAILGVAAVLLIVGGLAVGLYLRQRQPEQTFEAPPAIYCPSCGAQNAAGNRFCLKCGTPLS
jgi:photosystem II stability/assembly factor-like uncharacterized protein